jgi:anti-sigma B factor antagonist
MSLATAYLSNPLTTRSPHRDLVADGPLDAEAVLALRREVSEAVADAPTIVLLDISTVTKITPSGIAGMLNLMRIARSGGGDFRVHGRSRVVERANSAMKLTSVIAVYGTRSDALDSVR